MSPKGICRALLRTAELAVLMMNSSLGQSNASANIQVRKASRQQLVNESCYSLTIAFLTSITFINNATPSISQR